MSRSKLFEQEQKLQMGKGSSPEVKAPLGGNRDSLGGQSLRTDLSAMASEKPDHSAFDAVSGATLTPMSTASAMSAGAPVQAKKGRKGKTVDIDKFMYEDDFFMTPDSELEEDPYDDVLPTGQWAEPALDDDALATAHIAEMIAPRKRSRNPFRRFR